MNILQKLFTQKEEVDLKDLVKKGAHIIDVRSEAEYKGGHVEGALNIPLDALHLILKKVEKKDSHMITCCLSGGRSSVAKRALEALGYSNVHDGGGWQSLQKKLA